MGKWQTILEGDPNDAFINDGIHNEFDIIVPNSVLTDSFTYNNRPVTDPVIRSAIDSIIHEEIRQGRYIVTNCWPTIVSHWGSSKIGWVVQTVALV